MMGRCSQCNRELPWPPAGMAYHCKMFGNGHVLKDMRSPKQDTVAKAAMTAYLMIPVWILMVVFFFALASAMVEEVSSWF